MMCTKFRKNVTFQAPSTRWRTLETYNRVFLILQKRKLSTEFYVSYIEFSDLADSSTKQFHSKRN